MRLQGDPFEHARRACAAVAERSRQVRIDAAALQAYAKRLPLDEIRAPQPDASTPSFGDDAESAATWVLVLDAVNFGSGWFPELRKRAGLSGFRTLEACLRDWFAREGRPSAARLAAIDAAGCAEVFGQTEAPPVVGELMQLFARAWRDLGRLLALQSGGSSLELVRQARGSAASLVGRLLEMPLYRDLARYDGRTVPFLKRAQLTAFDADLLLRDSVGRFDDLDRLTIFADNLVPHVLRLDGVLHFEASLVERIERGETLASGSPPEVEIRACALHAAEQIAALLPITPAELDTWLWRRGGGATYKARPRHRTRCPYY